MKFTRFSLFLAAFALIGLSVSMFSNISTSEAAFGTSPPWVRNDHLLPGTTFEQVVNLSRNETEEEMKAAVRISGDKEVMKWIKIQDEKNLIMKKGQAILPMKVIVNVPNHAVIKNYIGGIFVSLSPVRQEAGQGGEVAITLGAHIVVDLTVVGEKITDYRIKSISVDPLQEGDPFSLSVEVENLGNTEISDPKGQIDIYNSAQTEILKSLTFISLSDPISPDETKISKMVFGDIKLDPGEYWVVAKAFKDGKVAYENRLFQEVKTKVVPVITPEDVVPRKPSLPKTIEEMAVVPPAAQAPASDVRPAAPVPAETNSVYLIFGLAGLGLGLIALIGIIVVLIIVLKNQQQATIERYLAQNQFRERSKDGNTGEKK